MSEQEKTAAPRVLLGISMFILAGLIFAAGVMFGRKLGLEEGALRANALTPLEQIAQSDKAEESEQLDFHEILDEPSKKSAPQRANPKPLKSTPEPNPKVEKKVQVEIPNQSDGKYSLQIAAYKDIAQAQELSLKLSKLGFSNVRLVKSSVGDKGIYFRVRLGRFADKDEAERFRKKLAVDQAMDSIVVLE